MGHESKIRRKAWATPSIQPVSFSAPIEQCSCSCSGGAGAGSGDGVDIEENDNLGETSYLGSNLHSTV